MDLYLGKEREFNFNELFFSRTDAKGIIQSGNSVFQRISQYEWDEMLNKPHNIIRHPAMPKGVFHLLWETIRAGESIAAYVVNQAKSGAFYWVFALVLPVKNGYVSIRLKPSSSIFDIIKQKYAELLTLEKTQKLSPKQSQAVLLEVIQSLNFLNYRQFLTEALTQELEARQKSSQCRTPQSNFTASGGSATWAATSEELRRYFPCLPKERLSTSQPRSTGGSHRRRGRPHRCDLFPIRWTRSTNPGRNQEVCRCWQFSARKSH